MLEDGQLTAGHARALLGSVEPLSLASIVVKEGLNVRQTEELVRREGAKSSVSPSPRTPSAVDADVKEFEERLSRRFGLPIAIRQKKDGGELVVRWRTLDQLDRFLQQVGSDTGGDG